MPGITLAEQGVPVIEGVMVIWVWRVIIGLVIINVTFVIVALVRPVVRSEGGHVVTWDGRDDAGRGMASGVYWAELTAGGGAAERVKLNLVR